MTETAFLSQKKRYTKSRCRDVGLVSELHAPTHRLLPHAKLVHTHANGAGRPKDPSKAQNSAFKKKTKKKQTNKKQTKSPPQKKNNNNWKTRTQKQKSWFGLVRWGPHHMASEMCDTLLFKPFSTSINYLRVTQTLFYWIFRAIRMSSANDCVVPNHSYTTFVIWLSLKAYTTFVIWLSLKAVWKH